MHLSSHDSFHPLPPVIGSFNYLLQGGFSKFSIIIMEGGLEWKKQKR